ILWSRGPKIHPLTRRMRIRIRDVGGGEVCVMRRIGVKDGGTTPSGFASDVAALVKANSVKWTGRVGGVRMLKQSFVFDLTFKQVSI
ncbi:hypothetical protein BaRGS_00017961, partial [Batillaria attramentaria]